MDAIHNIARERDIGLENYAAALTEVAYPVILRHGIDGSWLDLELDLWRALAETVKQRVRDAHPPHS